MDSQPKRWAIRLAVYTTLLSSIASLVPKSASVIRRQTDDAVAFDNQREVISKAREICDSPDALLANAQGAEHVRSFHVDVSPTATLMNDSFEIPRTHTEFEVACRAADAAG